MQYPLHLLKWECCSVILPSSPESFEPANGHWTAQMFTPSPTKTRRRIITEESSPGKTPQHMDVASPACVTGTSYCTTRAVPRSCACGKSVNAKHGTHQPVAGRPATVASTDVALLLGPSARNTEAEASTCENVTELRGMEAPVPTACRKRLDGCSSAQIRRAFRKNVDAHLNVCFFQRPVPRKQPQCPVDFYSRGVDLLHANSTRLCSCDACPLSVTEHALKGGQVLPNSCVDNSAVHNPPRELRLACGMWSGWYSLTVRVHSAVLKLHNVNTTQPATTHSSM